MPPAAQTIPGLEFGIWHGIAGPAGMDPALATRIVTESADGNRVVLALAFRRLGLASMADARARRARGELEEELPDVFLVVDNWAALKRDFEGLDQEVEQLANGGLNYGVHLLLSRTKLGRVLRAAKDQGEPYHVVHFDGHGV